MQSRFLVAAGAAILCALPLTGCKTVPTQPAAEPSTSVEWPVLVRARNSLSKSTSSSSSIAGRLGTIPGALVGDDQGHPVMIVASDGTGVLKVDMTRVARLAADAATTTTDIEWNEGLRFQPTDVKVARISTYALDNRTKRELRAATWLQDTRRQGMVLLVYFDKACSVTGTVSWEAKPTHVDLSIPGPGLYWLLTTESARENRMTQLSSAADMAFAVELAP